jgi:hypothetical protein
MGGRHHGRPVDGLHGGAAVMDAFALWLESTAASKVVTHYSWIWPACETLHFVGLSLLIGNVGLFDLRLLGAAKRLPVAPLNRLVRWGVAGFLLNLITGLVFFVGAPTQYVNNLAFHLKLIFILLAGLNLAAFNLGGVARTVAILEPGQDAPMSAKIIAATSLFLWVGVMFWGRMLPFIGNAF